MSVQATCRLLVCGSIDRCDDGAAIRATAALMPSPREEGEWRVDVRRCGQLDVEHVLDIAVGTPLVIVDTAFGVPAGDIVTITFDELLANPRGPAPRSSHALPIDQVLGLTRLLADAPVEGLFVGIGGEDFGLGEDLSPKVREALPAYARAIGAAIATVGQGVAA